MGVLHVGEMGVRNFACPFSRLIRSRVALILSPSAWGGGMGGEWVGEGLGGCWRGGGFGLIDSLGFFIFGLELRLVGLDGLVLAVGTAEALKGAVASDEQLV